VLLFFLNLFGRGGFSCPDGSSGRLAGGKELMVDEKEMRTRKVSSPECGEWVD
jgi:hypothetical protein